MRTTVFDVTSTGVILASENDGQQYWLPADEWSVNTSEWKSALLGLELGSELDVVELGRVIDHRPVVSRKHFRAEDVDSAWLNSIRTMRIEEISKILIRGTIEETVPAEVNGQVY